MAEVNATGSSSLTVRLESATRQRLQRLASASGRPEAYFVKQALAVALPELERTHAAALLAGFDDGRVAELFADACRSLDARYVQAADRCRAEGAEVEAARWRDRHLELLGERAAAAGAGRDVQVVKILEWRARQSELEALGVS